MGLDVEIQPAPHLDNSKWLLKTVTRWLEAPGVYCTGLLKYWFLKDCLLESTVFVLPLKQATESHKQVVFVT